MTHAEEALDNTDTSSGDRKQIQSEVSARKQELEAIAAVEQQQQTAEMEAEEQLRTEQAKLNDLEERVDRLRILALISMSFLATPLNLQGVRRLRQFRVSLATAHADLSLLTADTGI